jgi:RNA polymerase sigma-70 factor (ECF subfamily)
MPQETQTKSETGGSTADLEKIRATLAVAVHQVCPYWLASDAEDITQEAMIKVLRILKRNEGKDDFSSSYLWRVAYSATIDEIRRRRRRREVSMDAETMTEEPITPAPSPESRSMARGIGQAIRDCLDDLIPTRRRAVTLRLLGHSVGEAASLLGWPPKRAENLIYRGLADVRGCLERKGVRP